jgi:uncharacterized protein YndB with AHSA1/START domain
MPTKSTNEKALPLGKGKLGFTVSNEYPVSAQKVWEAITKAKHVQKFFVDQVTGDYTARLTPVGWYWKRWGQHYHQPTVFQKGKKLEFTWPSHSGKYLTTVTFTLKKKGKLTELSIHERGWKQSDQKNVFSNCEGWTTYLCYLKTYLMFGKTMRTDK